MATISNIYSDIVKFYGFRLPCFENLRIWIEEKVLRYLIKNAY